MQIKTIGGSGAALRAHLALGNVSIAQHQLGIMLKLGAQRIICISQKLDAEMIALQHIAEDAGAKFHVVTGPRGVLGLVNATDELLSMVDGLLAWPKLAAELLDRAAVVVQPIDDGLAAGFERLDTQYAAAGAFQLPGRLVERLAELPPDSDCFAALQRIALQAGIAMRPMPEQAINNGSWNLVRHDDEAHAVETLWIRLHTDVLGARTLSTRIAQWAVRALGPALLHAGSGNLIVANAALVLALLALVAGWFGWISGGLVMTAIAAILFVAANLLGRVECEMQQLPPRWAWRRHIYDWLVDGVLLLLLLWNAPSLGEQSGAIADYGLLDNLFAPMVLLAFIRILPNFSPAKSSESAQSVTANWRDWLSDRCLLALSLALMALGGVLAQGVMILTLLLLALAILGGRIASGGEGKALA